MTVDLVTFLRARLAEEYRLAAPAYHPMFVTAVPGSERKWPDPARVLAEVEAKRRTLERHADCGTGIGYCDDGGHGWDEDGVRGCADLLDLALPFASHPDYDEAWRVA